jgi:hypothetical protein
MEVEDSPAAEDAATNSQEATKSAPPLAPPITALGTGKQQTQSQVISCITDEAYVCTAGSGRRKPQEAINVLVLCWLLHRLV